MKKTETFKEIQPWDSYRGIVRSRKGGWLRGKGVFIHGYSMMEDLVGKTSFFQVMILNATGRLPERRLADWFEALQICLSYPDPRIWCNQVGALGGTMRTSAVAATGAGILAHDSKIYGPKTLVKGMTFIQKALSKQKEGLSVKEIVSAEIAPSGGKPKIMGYGRPVVRGDERLPAMERVARELEFSVGEHLELAYQVEKILMEEFDEGMNISGYMAAFLSDQGYSPQEAYQIVPVLVASGVTACYVDTLERPAETFLPLRCDDMDYQGPPPRPVPLPEGREKS